MGEGVVTHRPSPQQHCSCIPVLYNSERCNVKTDFNIETHSVLKNSVPLQYLSLQMMSIGIEKMRNFTLIRKPMRNVRKKSIQESYRLVTCIKIYTKILGSLGTHEYLYFRIVDCKFGRNGMIN
jgi:hypothetical protein